MNDRHLDRPALRTLRAITRHPTTTTVVRLLLTAALRIITDTLTHS
ncbi:hypothetical protein ACW14Y_18315 [Kitasatospora sp. cg17-2]